MKNKIVKKINLFIILSSTYLSVDPSPFLLGSREQDEIYHIRLRLAIAFWPIQKDPSLSRAILR
jgi:hypothetical protein